MADEMHDWLMRGFGGGDVQAPVIRDPAEFVPPPIPAEVSPAPDPAPPIPSPDPYGMPTPAAGAPLELLLRAYAGAAGGFSKEQYEQFNGDQILESVRKYDPNAYWTPIEIGGGDAGTSQGLRLQFDPSLLPKSSMGVLGLDLRPSNDTTAGLYNPNMVYDDPVYGSVTNSANIRHKAEGLDKWAPLGAAAMMMAIPGLNAALLSAGLGSAGLTSAVTGAAAGLGAGSIPAATAAGATVPWWAKMPTTIAKTASNYWDPKGTGTWMPNLGAPPGSIPGEDATPPFVPWGTQGSYDPTAVTGGGSAAKPQSNDSSLVATQFAADPYGFSGGG